MLQEDHRLFRATVEKLDAAGPTVCGTGAGRLIFASALVFFRGHRNSQIPSNSNKACPTNRPRSPAKRPSHCLSDRVCPFGPRKTWKPPIKAITAKTVK